MKCWVWMVSLIPALGFAQKARQAPLFQPFYAVHYKGTIPVDEQGNPTDDGIDTVYTLVVELSAKDTASFKLQTVVIGQRRYQPVLRQSAKGKLPLVFDMEKQEQVFAHASQPQQVLLQFQLVETPKDKQTLTAASGTMLVLGNWQGKKQQWKTGKNRQLPSVHYP